MITRQFLTMSGIACPPGRIGMLEGLSLLMGRLWNLLQIDLGQLRSGEP